MNKLAYVIGVSSGIFGAASQEERIQGISAGLYRKAQYCITKGVEFVQIDLESISEFKDPDLKENMEKIKNLGITFGIHSETPAFGGREFPHLDSAISIDYERGHKRLLVVLEETGELGSKFVLMHSSESTPFLLLGRELQPTELIDFWGRPLGDFIIEQGGGKIEEGKNWIMNWLWEKGQEYIWIEFRGEAPEATIKLAKELRKMEHAHMRGLKGPEELPPEEIKNLETTVEKVYTKELTEAFIRHIKSRALHYGPERTAYYIIAKWMEVNNDPLWNSIIDASIDYYAKVEGKTREEWLSDKKIEKVGGKWSIDDEKFRLESRLWVPSVSAKYVWGHFMQEKCPTGKVYPDPKELLKKYKMPFLLETPMAAMGLEEWLRLPNPVQMYHLCKEVGFEYMQLAIDLEHMLMCNLNPEISFNLFPEDGGKIVKVVHAGWPVPLGPAHIPIPLGSEQQLYLYKMYYLLRQKGFGKDPKSEHFLVFERGGGADPIQQSVLALRLIVEYLRQDTPPDKLPPDFFGVSTKEFLSPERQWTTIFEHARDPIRALLAVPEERYTFLGRAATEKGKRPEEWAREELK